MFDRLKEPLKLAGDKDKIPEPLKVVGGKGKIPVIKPAAFSKFQKVRDKRDPHSKQASISVLNCGCCLEDGHISAQLSHPKNLKFINCCLIGIFRNFFLKAYKLNSNFPGKIFNIKMS